MSQPLDKVVNDWASIKKPAFKAVVGASFGLAILSVFARAWIRFKTRRRISLDDYFLFLLHCVSLPQRVLSIGYVMSFTLPQLSRKTGL
ncbi:hypothetical protein PG984_012833 [Apiospora sp. TS-2023a]